MMPAPHVTTAVVSRTMTAMIFLTDPSGVMAARQDFIAATSSQRANTRLHKVVTPVHRAEPGQLQRTG